MALMLACLVAWIQLGYRDKQRQIDELCRKQVDQANSIREIEDKAQFAEADAHHLRVAMYREFNRWNDNKSVAKNELDAARHLAIRVRMALFLALLEGVDEERYGKEKSARLWERAKADSATTGVERR